MKYDVEVTRISYARQTVSIEAESVDRAKELALIQAPEEEFSTYGNEYEVSFVQTSTEEDHSLPSTCEFEPDWDGPGVSW